MRLYSGSTSQFIEDNVQNQIAGKLKDAFFRHFRFYPSDNEVRSWKNSLKAVTLILQSADMYDQGIILEYQLPLTSKRLDCLICGKDDESQDNAVIIELKQWEGCSEAEGERVVTRGRERGGTKGERGNGWKCELEKKDKYSGPC